MKYHTLFFQNLGKLSPYLLSAAVVIGALTWMRKFWNDQDFLIEHWHMMCIMSM